MVARAVTLTEARDSGICRRAKGRGREREQLFAGDPDGALDTFGGQRGAQRLTECIRPEGGLLERLGQRSTELAQVLDVLLA